MSEYRDIFCFPVGSRNGRYRRRDRRAEFVIRHTPVLEQSHNNDESLHYGAKGSIFGIPGLRCVKIRISLKETQRNKVKYIFWLDYQTYRMRYNLWLWLGTIHFKAAFPMYIGYNRIIALVLLLKMKNAAIVNNGQYSCCCCCCCGRWWWWWRRRKNWKPAWRRC